MTDRKRLVFALALLFGSGLALGIAPTAARAEMLEFVFSTNVDGTGFGLPASQPVTLRYRYDPLTVPLLFELGTPVVRVFYGQVPGTLTVGSDVVLLSGQLVLDDENNGHDSYTFLAANNFEGTTVEGSVNGTVVGSCELYLLDQSQPSTMLASLEPPATTTFFSDATLVRLDFREDPPFIAMRDFAPDEFESFSFTVPEPGAAWQIIAAAPLAILAVMRRPRVSRRWRSRDPLPLSGPGKAACFY